MKNRLDKIWKKSLRIKIDNQSKIVIMSDIHRGSGDNYDNFLKNENIYMSALIHYYHHDFKYIELGDGDDMWEVKNYQDIINEHLRTFKILKKYHDNNRLIMVYGNHDICKKSNEVLKKYFYKYNNEDLLNNLIVYESLVLESNYQDILLLHGHQVDLLNSTFWRLSRFLVRYIWRNLEKLGIKDPTGATKNYTISKKVEKRLNKWSNKNNVLVISGHTHRPIFPQVGESKYFNGGSCIHPNGITCIEINDGKIALVRWHEELKNGNIIAVGREVINAPVDIQKFFH